MATYISYKLSDLIERRSLLARLPDRPLVYLSMSDPELQRLLDDTTDHATTNAESQNENTNVRITEVFSMFKTYLEEKIDEKEQQLELKSKTEKEVVQLNYKGNQKQYELNAKLDAILDAVAKANNAENARQRIAALVTEAKALLKRRQKLIKIADRNKNGWKVVEEYESDDLASDSEDERRLKRAKEAASRKRKPNVFQPVGQVKRQRFGADTDHTLFRGKSYTNCFDFFGIFFLFYFWILCIFYWSGSSGNPTISYLCCLIFSGLKLKIFYVRLNAVNKNINEFSAGTHE